MTQAEKQHTRFLVWLEQAKYDLDAAEVSFKAGNFEWACYQSTQSVEKSIKAVIVHAGYPPPKVHKLGVLMGLANRANKLFFNVKLDYRKIEAYTFISRYPFIIPGQNKSPHEFIDENDARTCLNLSMEVYKKISDFVKQGKITKGDGKLVDLEEYYYTGAEIEDRIQRIIEILTSAEELDIEKIILYGGFARDKVRPKSSTMDVLIVAKTKMAFIERIQFVRDLTKGTDPIIEPLVYTPEEFDWMLKEEGEGYLETAIGEGRAVYEKKFKDIVN